MKKRLICGLLAAWMLLLPPVSVRASGDDGAAEAAGAAAEAVETAELQAAEGAIDVAAPSAILMERSTGAVLYEKNAHEKLAPASVTKVMTLLLVMEALDEGRIGWDDTVTTSENAAAKGGSQIYLEVGEQLPLKEMLKAVVVSSANDCAAALAEHVAGSEQAFVAMMNERAAELGMEDTHFVNCTGLDDGEDAGEHRTSSYDIALMSRALLGHEEIKEYTTIWMDSVRDGQFGLSNTNKLVRFYQGATGLKTGFTSGAGYCLSASAERDDVEYIAVVMHCETSDQRFSSARTLLDYGFANYALVSPQPEEALEPVTVRLGKAQTVTPELSAPGSILVSKGDAAAATREVSLSETVEAPVEKGQVLGQVTVRAGDKVLCEVPLVASEAVERLGFWDAAMLVFRRACLG